MLRIGTKEPQGECGNVHLCRLVTQPADEKRLKTEGRGAGSQRLLDRIEGTQKALTLHHYEPAGMSCHPLGLVLRVEGTLQLENCHG